MKEWIIRIAFYICNLVIFVSGLWSLVIGTVFEDMFLFNFGTFILIIQVCTLISLVTVPKSVTLKTCN